MPIDKTLLVGGQWQIDQLIGNGAAGEVYAAFDDDSGEIVAVKFEHQGSSLLKKERDIYEHLLGSLNAPSSRAFGIPNIHFYGTHGNDYEALVMDCLGPSLSSIQEQSRQKVNPETSSKIATLALDILQFVHSRGVVHCDITPRNLLIGRNDANALYLVDFGLAEVPVSWSHLADMRILDLEGLGEVLYFLRTGKIYVRRQLAREMPLELDRYFEMLQSDQMKNQIDYRPLRRIFELVLDALE